jgi:hypothetical protein
MKGISSLDFISKPLNERLKYITRNNILSENIIS